MPVQSERNMQNENLMSYTKSRGMTIICMTLAPDYYMLHLSCCLLIRSESFSTARSASDSECSAMSCSSSPSGCGFDYMCRDTITSKHAHVISACDAHDQHKDWPSRWSVRVTHTTNTRTDLPGDQCVWRTRPTQGLTFPVISACDAHDQHKDWPSQWRRAQTLFWPEQEP